MGSSSSKKSAYSRTVYGDTTTSNPYAYSKTDNNGTISYIPARRTFEIDMIANPKKSDGYKFSYAKFDNLPRNLSSIWDEELAPAVECRFYTIIRSLADMINYAGSYSNIEFVND